MTKKDDRDPPFSYRPPAGKGAELRAELKARGVSFNAFVTSLIYGGSLPRSTRHPPAEKRMLAHLLGRSAAIRDALDTASRVGGEDIRLAAAIERAHDELSVIRAAVLKMLERDP